MPLKNYVSIITLASLVAGSAIARMSIESQSNAEFQPKASVAVSPQADAIMDVKTSLMADEFFVIPETETYTNKQLQAMFMRMKADEEAIERVGGPGTRAPWADDYYWQKAWRIGVSSLKFGAEMFVTTTLPIVSKVAVRLTGDNVLALVGPRFADLAAQKAEDLASKAMPNLLKSFPWAESITRSFAGNTARGETWRNAGAVTDFAERHVGTAARILYDGGRRIYSATKTVGSAIISGVKSTWGWLRGSSSSETAA